MTPLPLFVLVRFLRIPLPVRRTYFLNEPIVEISSPSKMLFKWSMKTHCGGVLKDEINCHHFNDYYMIVFNNNWKKTACPSLINIHLNYVNYKHSYFYSPYKAVWWIPKSILIAYQKYLSLEINAIKKSYYWRGLFIVYIHISYYSLFTMVREDSSFQFSNHNDNT